MKKFLFDYSHYVEVVDEEECGCFRRWPTGLVDFAENIGVPLQKSLRFFPGDLGAQIVRYERERLELFELIGGEYYCKICPHCNCKLETVHSDNRKYNSVFGKIFISVCPNCGWWESSDECIIEYGEDNWYRSREIRRKALLKEFSVGGSEVPLITLRTYIKKNPEYIRFINPKKLEELVGSVFGEFMNCESIHIGGPNDGGIDVILINSENQYVIQVKRRLSSQKAESVSGIREFLGAMLLRGDVKGIFVSTAPKFSPQASLAASVARDRKLVEFIELIDAQKLIDVCKLTSKNLKAPWENFITTAKDPPPDFPETKEYFAFPVGK